jgi:NAD(P)H dehydrogenase (quinone)
MRVLVVFCHPCEDSFSGAVLGTALKALAKRGHEIRVEDLYRQGFDPVMSALEWRGYPDPARNLDPVADRAAQLAWAEAVVFIYPTWWYGLPAMLKGWLERVLVPGFAFEIPTETKGSVPKLRHIRHVIVLTTCGATPLVSRVMGQPGRRTLLRGFRSICATTCRTAYLALYRMDTVSEAQRRDHLDRVKSKLLKLL